MNADDIRLLSFYYIPKDWNIHLIDRRTNEKQLETIQQIIENAHLFAFDTETMPSFYHSKWHSTPQTPSMSKPSLLQVAVRHPGRNGKNVLLFDLQELFDQSNVHFCECSTSSFVQTLIRLIFNHADASKLSQALQSDLAQLKCSYDEECFHTSKLHHIIELSDIYRQVFPDEKPQQIYSLQRMTAMTLHHQLNKKQQCANWSKRPLTQVLKDYAAIDVIVMIDIYDRLKSKIDQATQPLSWVTLQDSVESLVDLNEIIIYQCGCGERFVTNKARNRHGRTCLEEQRRVEEETAGTSETLTRKRKPQTQLTNSLEPQINEQSSLPELDYNAPAPCGRGYLPPALKRAYQSMNQISLYEQVRCSSASKNLDQLNENRPPDARFFLEDDDTEVAQAFGLELKKSVSKAKVLVKTQSNVPVKQNIKIAAFPPRTNSQSLNSERLFPDENDLLDRLQDDSDSQPEFHCHLFGLGGRGRSSKLHLPPPAPSLSRQHYFTSFQ